ncbi:hypothetical protein OG592_21040 [Streptomyces avidinii]|uniref:hypothetical protein n=1 Tax=Streptomyces avidinii TaxID=1895 RepID=UPI0038702941|nr:hypothetical protein OG592_21040 [Streptomyces avidinii]
MSPTSPQRRRFFRDPRVALSTALLALAVSIGSAVTTGIITQNEIHHLSQCIPAVVLTDNHEDAESDAILVIAGTYAQSDTQVLLERLTEAEADYQALLDESSDCVTKERRQRLRSTLHLIKSALAALKKASALMPGRATPSASPPPSPQPS